MRLGSHASHACIRGLLLLEVHVGEVYDSGIKENTEPGVQRSQEILQMQMAFGTLDARSQFVCCSLCSHCSHKQRTNPR